MKESIRRPINTGAVIDREPFIVCYRDAGASIWKALESQFSRVGAHKAANIVQHHERINGRLTEVNVFHRDEIRFIGDQ